MPRFVWPGLIVAGLLSAGCSPPATAPQPPEPPVVTVAYPVEREIAPYTEYIGRTDAVKTVDIIPEVSGMLKSVQFKDGAVVKEGDVLYQIDPVPYRAHLDKAQADVANGKATLALAEAELKQMKQASASGAASQNDLDKAVSKRDSAAAAIQAAEAAVAKAKFEFEKTTVRSPITGRIERTLLTEGNLVAANTTRLTRILTIHPIYAYWDIDEMTSLRYRDMIYKTKVLPNPRDSATPLKCWIRTKNETEWKREGIVDYIEIEFNRASATRPIRGIFSNEDQYLSIGDSVRVRIEAGPSRKAIMIPEIAVGSPQRQKFVYIINDKNEAVFTPVELGEVREGMQIIEKGLTTKDRIVVNGLLRVRPGAVVKPVEQTTPAASAGK
jgi:RND family efflux transporter MFP subunit